MIIVNDTDFRFKDTCVTVGKFETLHIGHKALMERMDEFRRQGLSAVVLRLEMPAREENEKPNTGDNTDKSPNGGITAGRTGGTGAGVLRTEEERIELLKALGIDIYIKLPFTEQIAHMSPEGFVKQILVEKLGAGAVVVGDDFHFGYERKGDTEFLKSEGRKYGFETVVLDRIRYDGQTVSSTLIRELIRENKLEEAYKMLGK